MDLETIGYWAGLVTDWSLIAVVIVLWRWVRYLHRRIDVIEYGDAEADRMLLDIEADERRGYNADHIDSPWAELEATRDDSDPGVR